MSTRTSSVTCPRRVGELIDRFAAISSTEPADGVTRLGYTELEREAHDVFAQHLSGLGLEVCSDTAGNTIATLPGSSRLPALATGSHLDSVPLGGRYDGVVGVVAAMLTAEELRRRGGLRHPVRFLVFANEEGARFGQACNGSRALARQLPAADLDRLRDADGVSLAEAMACVGLDPGRIGEAALDPAEWSAFVEVHIEQGNLLAERGVDLGVVDVISGSTRLQLEVTGVPSHSGGTPMAHRHDALVTAARIVVAGREIATDTRQEGARITVGRLDVEPNSLTTIPGRVALAIDIRDIDPLRQRRIADELLQRAAQLAAQEGTAISVEPLADADPTVLPAAITSECATAIDELGFSRLIMPSGASHDSQWMNLVCPAGMIFVPSGNGGISHAPQEWTAASDIARGVDALVAALVRLDRTRDHGGGPL